MVLCLLLLGEGDEGVLVPSSPVSLGGGVGPESISACSLCKQLNIKMTIINSLSLFLRTLTSGAQRCDDRTSPSCRSEVPTEISWLSSVCVVLFLLRHYVKRGNPICNF